MSEIKTGESGRGVHKRRRKELELKGARHCLRKEGQRVVHESSIRKIHLSTPIQLYIHLFSNI